MRMRNRLARLYRALSGESQKTYGEKTGVHPTLLAEHESGVTEPGLETLERLAQGVDLTIEAGEEILRFADTLRQPRRRTGLGLEELSAGLTAISTATYQRLLRLRLPESPPKAEDRHGAMTQWSCLKDLSEDQQYAVVTTIRDYQNWALAELLCEESVQEASRDLKRAAGLARIAREVAERVRGPEGWCLRLRGWVKAHEPNILRVSGDLKAAEATLREAKLIWEAGLDPLGLLDPGRLLDLEAALRRSQRRFEDALDLLDRAKAVSHYPERAMVMKGFTLEVMGEYDKSLAALLEAEPFATSGGNPRLLYMLRFNVAVNYTHLGRYDEATRLIGDVLRRARERGDVNEISRVTWLEGRIAAGLGRSEEARALLARARSEFAAREMWYDVALALLEEAALLLGEGRTAEVKDVALELQKVFGANGVHREALAALRLFAEAARREAATAEMGRRVLRYLFRARHDEELKLGES